MKRSAFIRLMSLLGAGSFAPGCNTRGRKPGGVFPGVLTGADHKTGHMLRRAISLPVSEEINVETLIAGGGCAGLTAAYFLKKGGYDNFVLVELESTPGGNAAAGRNNVSQFPWGAHYLPVPDNNQPALLDFLAENKIITGFDAEGRPFYNEDHLCFAPEERLFIYNRWQEGLIPQFGLKDKSLQQIRRFLDLMVSHKNATGKDNKPAFCIPVAQSSEDPTFQELHSITFAQFLAHHGFDDEHLRWYTDYCCLDDYGTAADEVSAWAGIHYFASRKGTTAEGTEGEVLTWPEGNQFLVNLLAKPVQEHIHTGQLVFSVEEKADHCRVLMYDTMADRVVAYTTSSVIMATPQFINRRILRSGNIPHIPDTDYAPWMVANVTLRVFPDKNGFPLAWDNVIFGSKSLGYVNAGHQQVALKNKKTVFTFYHPLAGLSPAEERKTALSKTLYDWQKLVVDELNRAHPDISDYIESIDVWLWGHAMIRPVPGITGNSHLAALAQHKGRIMFAHSDLSGLSIFEEAFYHGHRAAMSVLEQHAS